MNRKVIGYILILIAFAVLLINKVYLQPNEMQNIPSWILVVCALLGGYLISSKSDNIDR